MPTSPNATPAAAAPIALAGFKQIYSTARVESALDGLPPTANESLRGVYERMIRSGGERFTVKPSAMPDFDRLEDELPNFGEVLGDIRRQLALCLETQDPVELTPLLLLGDPGVGKTHFARRLSSVLGTSFGFVSMSSLTAGWILSGASSQWRNAKCGKVFETLVNGEFANPVLVVDELDKASTDGHYDPLGALYGLLEPSTARDFVDEFAEIPLDCSEIVWVATANDAERIPEPILNRMNVYEIPPPDAEGTRRIAASLYREIRDSHAWGDAFPEAMADEVLDRLAGCAPREMRRLLTAAFGNAKLAGRTALSAADLPQPRASRRPRIGF